MKKRTFWIKVSNYSITICAIVLFAKMFFEKYLEAIIVPMMTVGVIVGIIFVFSEIMKIITKK